MSPSKRGSNTLTITTRSRKRKWNEIDLVATASEMCKMNEAQLFQSLREQLQLKMLTINDYSMSLQTKLEVTNDLRYKCWVNLNYRKIIVLQKKDNFLKAVESCYKEEPKKG